MTAVEYRYMATEIRDLIPLLVHPQATADLRLLADRYERLAHDLEGAHAAPPDDRSLRRNSTTIASLLQ